MLRKQFGELEIAAGIGIKDSRQQKTSTEAANSSSPFIHTSSLPCWWSRSAERLQKLYEQRQTSGSQHCLPEEKRKGEWRRLPFHLPNGQWPVFNIANIGTGTVVEDLWGTEQHMVMCFWVLQCCLELDWKLKSELKLSLRLLPLLFSWPTYIPVLCKITCLLTFNVV